MVLCPRKMYTVNLPPEDYVPGSNSETNYENQESSNDSHAADTAGKRFLSQFSEAVNLQAIGESRS